MKEFIDGVEFDVIPMKDDMLYCYELNRKVYRNQHCSPDNNPAFRCSRCSLHAEIITAEQQKWVDHGYALWVVTEDNKKLAVQNIEYGKKVGAGYLKYIKSKKDE